MSRSCEISDVSVLSGSNVSHSNRKTKRKFLPNLQNVTLHSEALGRSFKMRIATRTLRSIDIKGGFDNYLMLTSSSKLTEEAAKLKKQIQKIINNKSN